MNAVLRCRSVLRRGLLAGLAALALTVAGCSSTAPGSGAPGAPASAGPGQPAATVAALDFTAPTLDGGPLDAATLAGTPVLLWFWTPF